MVGCKARLEERRAAKEAPEPETGVPSRLPRPVQLSVPLYRKSVQEYHEVLGDVTGCVEGPADGGNEHGKVKLS